MSAMDQSLDEIIAARPKNTRKGRRSAGGAARASVLGNKATPSPAVKAKAQQAAAATTPAPTASSTKIIVSNLPQDVTEPQIKELFSQTVGPLREVNLNHDANGRSKGIASITFQRKGDASKAFEAYNNRLIDGKRAMKIEIVMDPSRPQSLAARVAPAPQQAQQQANPASIRGSGRGGRRGGRGGGRNRAPRPKKTEADLDAEMEDWTNQPAAPAAAAPAPAA
ncbi:hypothetical protein DL96DRAFT_1597911 [Flagelloscypha sp. PMI_526]|nr:hypothetical protein DL96DRAFT_1597911 [Flagelloscypha sp. PMI_526]